MVKALIWFESHLGAGDAQLVATLCKGLEANGTEVTLVTSSYERWRHIFNFGHPHIISLPPLERGQDKHYYTPSGERFEGSNYEKYRSDTLQAAFDAVKPDAVITQSWPLMRQQFDREMTELIDRIFLTCPATMLINFPCDITYINDWLIEKRPFNMKNMLSRYHAIMVPGDGLLDFCSTHPFLESIRHKVRYPGYFVDTAVSSRAPSNEVVVCSGGAGTIPT